MRGAMKATPNATHGGRHDGRLGAVWSTCAAIAIGVAATGAGAQNPAPKIWDIAFGTPVAALPLDTFVDPACGTNGGPPALVLGGFADFAKCPVEKSTGLREIWFRYDDELEYIARARRSDTLVLAYQANAINGQPIILSLLIDDGGRVEGYRIVSDPRADAATRIDAFGLGDVFKGIANGPFACTDLDPAEGERPIQDWFVKQVCEGKQDGQVTRIEARHYLKPGQHEIDPNDNRPTENQFESSARMEVYRAPAGAR
jgi:hypothetical protein